MKRILLLSCLLLGGTLAQHALAQAPGGGGPQPGGGAGGGATGVPLDGGVSLLAASGAAYALKRLRQRQRRA